MDSHLGAENNDELQHNFQKYIRLCRDLVFNLPNERDRSVAALWVKRLATPPMEGEEVLPIEDKTNYARHLALCLHGPNLSGRMANPPPISGPLDPYPDFNLRGTLEELMADGTWKPTIRLHQRSREMASSWSGGGRVYASAQCLPGHLGAEAYIAVSPTPWEEQAADDLRLRAMLKASADQPNKSIAPRAPGRLPPVDWDSFTRDLMHDLVRERMESELATTVAQFGLEGLRVGTAPQIPDPLKTGSRNYLPQIPPTPRRRQLYEPFLEGASGDDGERDLFVGGGSRSRVAGPSRSRNVSPSRSQMSTASGIAGSTSRLKAASPPATASRQQMDGSASRQQIEPSASRKTMDGSASRQKMGSASSHMSNASKNKRAESEEEEEEGGEDLA